MAMSPIYRVSNHWGNFLWGFLHTITIIDHTDSDLQAHYTKRALKHMEAIVNAIPCLTCSSHYGQFVSALMDLSSSDCVRHRMWLFGKMVAFHNEVNRKNGKREWTVEEALERWAQTTPSCLDHTCGGH